MTNKRIRDFVRDFVEIAIIGGGPAGLAAAVSAYDSGCRDILLLERDDALGGILNQCIHSGFGLHRFGEELTGPEYAQRYIDMVRERGIDCRLNTTVLDIAPDLLVTAVSPEEGVMQIRAGAVILAAGCRERPAGAINIFGNRPAGVFTAGTAQRYVNIDGLMPGRRAVILGSGDIGLIMARRMTLEGAKVEAVLELMPFSGGLKRNIVQCLDDFGIPLLYSHTVTAVIGRERVEAVRIARVGADLRPVPGTERELRCDTLLLSVGLIPENELSQSAGVTLSEASGGPIVSHRFETSVPGIFACGNMLHVHDLADHVSEESERAAACAVAFAGGAAPAALGVKITAGSGVRYTVPSSADPAAGALLIRFRTDNVYEHKTVRVSLNGEPVMTAKKRMLTPGEMESVTVKAEIWEQFSRGGELTMEVV
ncbi:MAG: NAD(P)/FAD-dependent oxidoreductase [Oscillospiraceae bacterium]|nr:NAD(P)/FAD-dependent oxidoreductase [Oscillospiraceae bacterium]